jgi:TolB protein
MKLRIAVGPRPLALLVALLAASWVSPRAQSPAARQQLGAFSDQSDVGKVLHPGSATYDAARDEYTVSGSGTNMWLGADEFHFVRRRMKGDFILTARAELRASRG